MVLHHHLLHRSRLPSRLHLLVYHAHGHGENDGDDGDDGGDRGGHGRGDHDDRGGDRDGRGGHDDHAYANVRGSASENGNENGNASVHVCGD